MTTGTGVVQNKGNRQGESVPRPAGKRYVCLLDGSEALQQGRINAKSGVFIELYSKHLRLLDQLVHLEDLSREKWSWSSTLSELFTNQRQAEEQLRQNARILRIRENLGEELCCCLFE